MKEKQAEGKKVADIKDKRMEAVERDMKLYVNATLDDHPSEEARAFVDEQLAADPAQVEAELRARDEQDRSRAVAPLVPAADAAVLDTTELDAEAAFAAALALVRERLGEQSP
jgi:cytidylate kinase